MRGRVVTPPYSPDSPWSWAEAQNRLTDAHFHDCAVLPRCQAFLTPEMFHIDPPWRARRDQRLCVLRHGSGPAPRPRLCLESAPDGQRVLFDPNAHDVVLDPDHIAVSPSGRFVVFGVAPPAELMVRLWVYDLQADTVIDRQTVAGVQPHPSWLPDESGFLYSSCRRLMSAEPGPADGLYRHRLGSDWAEDACLADYADGAGHILFGDVVDDRFLLLTTHHFSSGRSGIAFRALDDDDAEPIPLFAEIADYTRLIGSAGGWWYFHSCEGTSHGRVVAIDPRRPAREHWREVVPEQPLALARPQRPDAPPLHGIGPAGLLLSYVQDASHVLHHHALGGERLSKCAPPTPSTIDAVYPDSIGFDVLAQSFLHPRDCYRFEAQSGLRLKYRQPTPGLDPADCKISRERGTAADGTPIPLFVLERHQRAAPAPTLLYGYGGFGQSLTPTFRPDAALWLTLGGVYAQAIIRGGGEFGQGWHAAGSRLNKQTSFNDFYAAAAQLLDCGIAMPGGLVAKGLSNGGLLTAVCANQRPELFAALVSEIPLTDLMWLGETPAGQALAAEFGNPASDPAARAAIESYSPLQNVVASSPPQYVVVADQDRSAPPGQAFAYVAARQAASDGSRPVLLRLLRGEGHSGWPPQTLQRVMAEGIAFLWSFAEAPHPGRFQQ
jgi:prolyl oligopeptidase